MNAAKWKERLQRVNPRWLAAEADGQGLVEYALIMVLVVLVVFIVVVWIGPWVGNIFSNVVYNL